MAIGNAVNGPEAAPYIAKAGGTMTGDLLLFNATPPLDLSAAPKIYVDTVAQGLNVVAACYAASTVALTVTYSNGSSGIGATLTNAGAMVAFAIDGVSPPLTSRILIKNQASTFQNGIYTVTTVGSGAANWVLTRATDYDQPTEINPGDFVLINFGTVNSATGWIETATVVTIGTSPILFSQFGAQFPLSLANGGTGAALTANNGGIFYSNATTGAILAGTATAGLALLSGATGAPTWSTNKPITRINYINFTGSGTYTASAGMVQAFIRLVAGGGGSGGSTGAAGQAAAPGGAGGGGYCESILTAAQVGASATVVIGLGGTAGTAGNNAGGDGGASSVTFTGTGTTMNAAGGSGSFGALSIATQNNYVGGTGGGASGGNSNNLSGKSGGVGATINGALGIMLPGPGGSSYMSLTGYSASGTTGSNSLYGGGASGSGNATGANAVGFIGAAGFCQIVEYISL